MNVIEEVLTKVVEASRPTSFDADVRQSIIHSVESALQQGLSAARYQNISILPYGSFVSGFYKSSSDLDLALVGFIATSQLRPKQLAEIERSGQAALDEDYIPLSALDKGTKSSLLRTCGDVLRKERIPQQFSMQYILHARVPIIKFKDARKGIDCDLCIGDIKTPFKAAMVKQISMVNPRFTDLFLVVKAWAKAHFINDGSTSTFNSWCLTLIVISYMQHFEPPLLPPLASLFYHDWQAVARPRLLTPGCKVDIRQAYDIATYRSQSAKAEFEGQPAGKSSLLELFTGFVDFLRDVLAESLEGPNSRLRLCAWRGELQEGKAFSKNYVMQVEDPFDDGDNVARTLGTWDEPPISLVFINRVFEATDEVLRAASEGTCSASTALAWLFGPSLFHDVPDVPEKLFPEDLRMWARQARNRRPPPPPAGLAPGVAIAHATVAAHELNQDVFEEMVLELGCPFELPTMAKTRAEMLSQGVQRSKGRKPPPRGQLGKDGLLLSLAESAAKKEVLAAAKKQRKKDKQVKRASQQQRQAKPVSRESTMVQERIADPLATSAFDAQAFAMAAAKAAIAIPCSLQGLIEEQSPTLHTVASSSTASTASIQGKCAISTNLPHSDEGSRHHAGINTSNIEAAATGQLHLDEQSSASAAASVDMRRESSTSIWIAKDPISVAESRAQGKRQTQKDVPSGGRPVSSQSGRGNYVTKSTLEGVESSSEQLPLGRARGGGSAAPRQYDVMDDHEAAIREGRRGRPEDKKRIVGRASGRVEHLAASTNNVADDRAILTGLQSNHRVGRNGQERMKEEDGHMNLAEVSREPCLPAVLLQQTGIPKGTKGVTPMLVNVGASNSASAADVVAASMKNLQVSQAGRS
ncbi:hypothetical protein CEUSTIGMA_g2421.t1 [Chlamydomonas eustigma]|uniref:Poly(A) RNA polymerase mitochondrial-like central palm domain-containing protein n=1 Tax=Chlamydomonas eustigma TaxID=1157962 RepID=A0A250WW03_9CHLO|nr:hypothetical protein CEUSTIGMA_g2421.t1 [Chlamydomonas eustigma]|eukprot:GAX74975.1 hypothetical protein CEUSTIGMA_g2421.t1 [Chlamydomonas eustigma]